MKQISLKLNFIMNMILTVSSIMFPLLTFPYVARILLPVGTGKVSLATSVINYFSLFAQLGVPTYGIRACAKVRDNKEELTRTAHELLFLNLFMCCIVYIVLTIYLIYSPKFIEDRELYIIMSTTIILTSIGMEWLYKGLEQYVYITIRSIIFKVIALIAVFALVHKESDYIIYGAITIFATSASNILNFINVHKYIDFKFVGNYHTKQHLKPMFTFFAIVCAATIYTNLDKVMLGFIKTDTEVGYYDAAVNVKGALTSVVTALGAVLLPRSSYYVENNLIDEFKSISHSALNFVCLLAIPLVVYFIFFAKESILFLSGDAYLNAILPMQIIMPTVLIIGLTNILGTQMLVPLGREKVVLIGVTLGAIIDVVLNIALIPKYASVGAAIGTLVAEITGLIVQYISLRDDAKKMFKGIHFIKIIIACLISIIPSVWIKSLNLGNFMTLVVSAILFFGIYGSILIITKEELVIDMLQEGINVIRGKLNSN